MEYEVKIKMVQEQWLQLKMKFLLVYNMKFVIKWGEWTLGGVGGGEVSWWGGWANVQLVGRVSPKPPIKKTLYPQGNMLGLKKMEIDININHSYQSCH